MVETAHYPWQPGDAVPWFRVAASNNPHFNFNAAAGRYTVLSFLGEPEGPLAKKVLSFILANRKKFDDRHLAFFGVLTGQLPNFTPTGLPLGIRYFWDTDRQVSSLYGAVDGERYRPFTLVLDGMLRVLAMLKLDNPEQHQKQLVAILSKLPPLGTADEPAHAPVLVLPRIFEPAFCQKLIGLYQQHGGVASGYMKEIDGRTVPVLNEKRKRRKDFRFDNEPEFETLRAAVRERVIRHLLPEIKKAFQYDVTRMERYIVAHYSAADQGFFGAHRDNTTPGTAHRRFACTINLNAEEFEGGELRFPEFGPRTYRAPTGGAVVFSCSLLHEATPVTQGERYAFLPFFYDDAAANIRQQNIDSLSDELHNA